VGSVALVHADDHFSTPGPPPPYATRPDMEHPASIDEPALLAAVRSAAAGAARAGMGVVVVEGFLILALPLVAAQLDAVLFLDADKALCSQRRLVRNPERSAAQAAALLSYYERCVWPGFMRHTVPAKERLLEAQALAARDGGAPRAPLIEVVDARGFQEVGPTPVRRARVPTVVSAAADGRGCPQEVDRALREAAAAALRQLL
jgi:hypothetical protein